MLAVGFHGSGCHSCIGRQGEHRRGEWIADGRNDKKPPLDKRRAEKNRDMSQIPHSPREDMHEGLVGKHPQYLVKENGYIKSMRLVYFIIHIIDHAFSPTVLI